MQDTSSTEFEKEMRTLNIFYSFMISIKSKVEKDENISSVFLNFEPVFHKINPDAALKLRKRAKNSYDVSFFEFKDAGREENVIKNKQIEKYDNISPEFLKSSGININRNASFGEFMLIFRILNKQDELTQKVYEKFPHKERYSLYSVIEKNPMEFEALPLEKSVMFDEYIKNPFIYKTWSIFKLNIKFPSRNLGSAADFKNNLAVFFALTISYILRNHHVTSFFSVEDILKFWNEKSLEIIKASYNYESIIDYFENALEEVFVTKKILKKEVLNTYKINNEKRLSDGRTFRSFIKFIKKYVDEDMFFKKYVNTLPLFNSTDM